jgi:hypothetical protein
MFLRTSLRPLRDFLSVLCGQKLFNRKGGKEIPQRSRRRTSRRKQSRQQKLTAES